MFEIPNMTKEELLFNFMYNLQSLVDQELRLYNIQDLATIMAVVDSLVKYKRGDSSKPKSPSKGNHAKGGEDMGETKDQDTKLHLRKGQARDLVARMAKVKTREKSSYLGPTTYAMVHIRHGTILRERP